MAVPESGLAVAAVLLGIALQLAWSPVRSLPELFAFAVPTGLSALVAVALGGTLLGVEAPGPWLALLAFAIAVSCIAAAPAIAELGPRRRRWLAVGVAGTWLLALGLEMLRIVFVSKAAHLLFATTSGVFVEDLVGVLRLAARFETGSFALYLGSYAQLASADYLVAFPTLALLGTAGVMYLTAFRTATALELPPRAAAIVAAVPLLIAATCFPLLQAGFRHDGHPLAVLLVTSAVAVAWLERLDRRDRSFTAALLLAAVSMCFELAPYLVAAWLATGLIDVAGRPRRLAVVGALAAGMSFWEATSALAGKSDGFAALLPCAIVLAGGAIRLVWVRGSVRLPDWVWRLLAIAAVGGAVFVLHRSGDDDLFRLGVWGGAFVLGVALSVWGALRGPREVAWLAVWVGVAIASCVVLADLDPERRVPHDKVLLIAAALMILAAGVMAAGAVARLGAFGGAPQWVAPRSAIGRSRLRPRVALAYAVVILLGFHVLVNVVVMRSNTRRLSERYRVWPPHNHFVIDHIEPGRH